MEGYQQGARLLSRKSEMSSTTRALGGSSSRWKQAAYRRSSAMVSKYLLQLLAEGTVL